MAKRGTVQHTGRGLPTRGRKTSPKAKGNKGAAFLFTIAIAGQPVQVFSLTRFPEDDQVGEYDAEHHEVFVRQGLPSPQAEADTMVHEVVHAINGIALAPEDRLSERQVNTLALTLVDTLARNPELKEYLFARL